MKKLFFSVGTSALMLLAACNSEQKSATEIKPTDMKDACDCNEGLMVVVDEMLALTKKFDNEESLMNDKDAAKKAESLFEKYEEIAKYCEDELKLDSKRDKFDCEKNNDKLSDKMKEVEKFF